MLVAYKQTSLQLLMVDQILFASLLCESFNSPADVREMKGSTKTWNPESGNGNGITETETETERNHGNGIRNPCKKAPSDRFVKKYVSNDNKINKQIKKMNKLLWQRRLLYD